MKNKSVAILSPLCLCLFAANAWAELEPFSFGLAETVQHQSNLNHTDSDVQPSVSDWISTTDFNAALNQAIGRDKLVVSADVNYNRYRRTHALSALGYQGAAEFDWNTVGDLSGALGGDSHRRQYISGETAEATPGSPATVNVRNLQTDNHAFARIALGGESRWTIFGGVDANQRNYSLDSFKSNEERQWSTNAGTRYSTSPDLSFGLTGSYVNGEYPDGAVGTNGQTITYSSSKFSTRSINATTQWKASGNSALDASLGYTSENNALLSSDRRFVNGSLNWTWTPPSRFTVNVGLKRSSDADTSSTGASMGIVNANNLNGTSVNNVAHFEVTYMLTAKINLDASADYTRRKYSDLKRTGSADVNGSTLTSRYYLTTHYRPTRTTDVSCGGGRETRRSDSNIGGLISAYTDNYLQCAASIHFD